LEIEMTRVLLDDAFAQQTPSKLYGAAMAVLVVLGLAVVAMAYLSAQPDTAPVAGFRAAYLESTGRAHLATSLTEPAKPARLTLPFASTGRVQTWVGRQPGGMAKHGHGYDRVN